MISSLISASQFLLEGINCGPGHPKNATTTGQWAIGRAGSGLENIKPLVGREPRRALADLDHPAIRGEADVNDDLRIHNVPVFLPGLETGGLLDCACSASPPFGVDRAHRLELRTCIGAGWPFGLAAIIAGVLGLCVLRHCLEARFGPTFGVGKLPPCVRQIERHARSEKRIGGGDYLLPPDTERLQAKRSPIVRLEPQRYACGQHRPRKLVRAFQS